MAGNSIGQLFTVTTFGESHGLALGAIVDGCDLRPGILNIADSDHDPQHVGPANQRRARFRPKGNSERLWT